VNAVVDPEQIPYTDVVLSGITGGATKLRTVASAVRDGTADVVRAWGRISGSYEGPSDQELFAVMTPIGPQGTTFGDDLDAAAGALDTFVDEVTPIVAQLTAYKARAVQLVRDVAAFQPVTIQTMDGPVTQTESWDQDETLNGENNDIINGVANRVVEYQAAERKCANTIRALNGLPPLHAIGASGDESLGYGYDELPMGTELPWGTAESRKESCAEKTTLFLPKMVKGIVWDGVIVGTIGGLGELVGVRDWKWSADNFTDTWKSLGGLVGYDKETGEWGDGDLAETWKAMGKGTVAWDKWADDPGTAFGESVWNIGSIFIPVANVAGKAGTAGKVGSIASGISKADRLLELADAGAWASKGLTKVLPKLTDLKSVLGRGFEHVSDGFATKIADFTTNLKEWRQGTHVDAESRADGPPVRTEGNADASVGADAHARTNSAESNAPAPVREPALVGGGHGESAAAHGDGADPQSGGGDAHGDFAGGRGGPGPGTESGGGVDGVDGAPGPGDGSSNPLEMSGSTGDLPEVYSHISLDSEGLDVRSLIDQSRLTPSQLRAFLESQWPRDGSLARAFEASGAWPHDVQIPRGPEVLTADGGINWEGVDNDGFASRDDGTIDRSPYDPPVGSVLDRYGPPDGRFTSPVPDDGPYSYGDRGLPYLEDDRHYHQYEILHDVGDLRGAYDSLDGDHRELVDALLQGRGKTADDLETLKSFRGEIAAVERFGSPGGGVQVQLPLPVEILQVLGILREIPRR